MIAVAHHSLVRDVCEDYSHLFRDTKLSFGPLSTLFSMGLFGAASLSAGARILPMSPSVSTLSQAIKDFDAEPFMKRARKILNASYHLPEKRERLVFVVDDTPIPKAGKSNYAVGLWTTSNNITYHGQKLLVLCAVDKVSGIAFPVAFRFCLKSEMPGYKKATQLVLELLDEAIQSGFPKAPLVADSWFDSAELLQGCLERDVHIFVEVKSNRKVRHATSRTIPKKKLSTYFKSGKRDPTEISIVSRKRKRKFICRKHAYISGHKSPVIIAAVFNRRLGYDVYGYFLTTDMQASSEKIWTMSRLRWSIEVLFRDLKQNFALGKLPGRSRADAEVSICIPFALVIHIRLSQMAENQVESEPQLETVGAYAKRLREESFSATIHKLCVSNQKKFRERVVARRSEERINRKPVNTGAGRNWEWFGQAATG